MVAGTAGGFKDGAWRSVTCTAADGRDKATTGDRNRSDGLVVVVLPIVDGDRGMTSLT